MIVVNEEILDRATCLDLLRTGKIGRVAVNVEGWPPVIRPVSYAYDESWHDIVFRTGHGSKLIALLTSKLAAFEVDHVDDETGVAWSVIAFGIVEPVTRADEIARFEELDIESWTPAAKSHWFELRPEQLSGRRLTRREGDG